MHTEYKKATKLDLMVQQRKKPIQDWKWTGGKGGEGECGGGKGRWTWRGDVERLVQQGSIVNSTLNRNNASVGSLYCRLLL